MKSRPILFASLVALLLLLAGTAVGLAQAPAPTPAPRQVTDDQVNAVARELYCPVCENIPLDVCPTTACAQWRDLIRQKLSIGWSKDQIKTYFAQQYGDRVLAQPPTQGLNLIVYILPPIFFLAGIYLVYRVMRNRKPSATFSATPPPPSPALDDPYMRRLQEELNKRK